MSAPILPPAKVRTVRAKGAPKTGAANTISPELSKVIQDIHGEDFDPEPPEGYTENLERLADLAETIAMAPDPVAEAFDPLVVDEMAERFHTDPKLFETTMAVVRAKEIPGLRVIEWERRIRARAKEIKLAGGVEVLKARRLGPAEDWKALLATHNGSYTPTCANVTTVLMHAPAWKGVLAFNEMAANIAKLSAPPWHHDDAPECDAKPGLWTEADGQRLANWMSRELEIDVSEKAAHRAAYLASKHASFHPARRYLEALTWDRKRRVQTWLKTYAKAHGQPEGYLERVGTWFLVSMVARAMEPGCQVDHAIVLEGEQGAGKSTLAKQLVPDTEWFAEHTAELGDKDAAMQLQGRWVIELAELDSLSRAEVGRVKRFISQSVDKFRPPYASTVGSFPRSCAFVGTVNDAEYLGDSTGNRRFWPVSVGTIDTDALACDRDQLFAEALFLYLNGARWWPDREDVQLLTHEQEQRRIGDPWEGSIEHWLEEWLRKPETLRGDCVAMDQLLGGAIGIAKDQRESKHAERVGKLMARLGWKRGRSRSANTEGDRENHDGKRRRIPVYYPPPG